MLKSDELMKELGSAKGFDPFPPDQYLSFIDERYPATWRLWAWVLSKTIRQGHRQPYCVDAKGRELRLQHAAADLDMDVSNVYRAWRELESEGRVRRTGEKGKLFICGDVRLPREQGEEEAKLSCTDNLPPYILLQVKKLPQARQEEFWARRKAEMDRARQLKADVMAAARCIETLLEDNLFASFGVKKIREADRREEPTALVEAILPLVEPGLRPGSNSVKQRVEMLARAIHVKRTSTIPAMATEATEMLKQADPGEVELAQELYESDYAARAQRPPQVEPVPMPSCDSDPLYEAFREMWKLVGREISVYKTREARRTFEIFDVPERRRILSDLAARFDGPWAKKIADGTLNITATWYLEAQLWRTEPISEPQIKPPNRRAQEEEASVQRIANYLEGKQRRAR